ncbi:MAG: AAA family ATPase [Betaproteobacteria bacterium]|nr:AAA family ATPase [Betaproteobacteria bacterium]
MYLEHYGLRESPFRITPHTDFFFDGAERGATLEALLYAVLHEEGIVKVSGEVGSGKTMLCRMLMERLPPEVDTVYIANPSLSRHEIMQAVAEELKLEMPGDSATAAMRELVARLIHIYASGHRVVILIDEAHAMPSDTLEQIRLLSNLETRRHKLLQIVLFGQPELDETLDTASMRQLKDRITHSFRTRALTAEEAARYLGFRMRAAGYKGPEVFAPRAVALIARAASGLTRRINILADKSLLAAFTDDTHGVGERHVRAAIRDSEFARLGRSAGVRWVLAGWATTAAILVVLGGYLLYQVTAGRETRSPIASGNTVSAAPAGPRAAPAASQAPAAPTSAATVSGAPPAAQVTSASPPTHGTPTTAPVSAVTGGANKPELPQAPESRHGAPPPPPLLEPEAFKRMTGYSPAGNALLRERLEATRAALTSEPDSHFSLELFMADNSDPARTERFLQRARDMVDLADLYVIPLASGKRYRLQVTYGAFPDRAAAADAVRRLPPKYRQAFQAEPKSFNELRAGLYVLGKPLRKEGR